MGSNDRLIELMNRKKEQLTVAVEDVLRNNRVTRTRGISIGVFHETKIVRGEQVFAGLRLQLMGKDTRIPVPLTDDEMFELDLATIALDLKCQISVQKAQQGTYFFVPESRHQDLGKKRTTLKMNRAISPFTDDTPPSRKNRKLDIFGRPIKNDED